MSGIKRAIGAVAAGVVVLAVAAGVGAAGLMLPDPLLNSPALALAPGAVSSNEGRVATMCLGGVERTVATGVNAAHADEKIRSATGALLAGVAPSAALPRWQTFTGKAPAVAARGATADTNLGTAVTTPVISGKFAAKTGLGTAALTGAASISRAVDPEAILMGGTAHIASAGDLRGLAHIPCEWPANSMWLVGSSSMVGTSNRLVLANPTFTNVQVKIRAFTSLGEVPLGTSSLAPLAPQTIKSISLDGLVNDDERVAFFLSAEAGQFAAALQTNALEGFTPAGIDVITAGREGRTVMVPGLVLPAGQVNLGGIKAAAETGKSARVDSAVKAGVRIVNPNSTAHTAAVALIGADGVARPLPGGEQVKLVAGGVLDLSLDGVAPGAYTVRVSADGTVAAGAFVRFDSGTAGKDIAWLASEGAVSHAGAAVGIGTAHLVVTPALSGEQAQEAVFSWKAFAADGKSIAEKKVTAKGSVAIALPAGAAYVSVNSAVPLYAAVAVRADLGNGSGISWVPLSQNGAGSSTTRVLFAN
ncbi:MAG: DUF5719 family protein [Arcanobacterium sp.]|nr:DUF5719 family protein [Arcanobacterium sp.]